MKFDDEYSGETSHDLTFSEGISGRENLKDVPRPESERVAARPNRGPEDNQNQPLALPASGKWPSERHWPQNLRVGYAAGAYDLFHIGHLNILRQAKQRCDYLIAGVVSDQMLRENKGVEPFIPEGERLSIVQSIEFVDEAILETLPDKLDTWKHLRFNVFFKGDDWRGTAKGLDLEERFGKVGTSVEYLPYTLHTSSTKLRLALENFERVARRQ